MMVRIATAALAIASIAAPAWAVDYCKTSVSGDGREALVDGLVDGATLKALQVEDDPIAATVALTNDGYTVAANGSATLTPYRSGQSVDGKDWLSPGSVATVFGGMALQWPRFYKDGKPVQDTLIVFEDGAVNQGVTSTGLATDPDTMTLYVSWGSGLPLPSPHGFRSTYLYGGDTWSSIAAPGRDLFVRFYDGKRTAPMGYATFRWPDDAPWNARLITQVNALREFWSARKCVDAETLADDPADDELDDPEFR